MVPTLQRMLVVQRLSCDVLVLNAVKTRVALTSRQTPTNVPFLRHSCIFRHNATLAHHTAVVKHNARACAFRVVCLSLQRYMPIHAAYVNDNVMLACCDSLTGLAAQ